MDVLVSKKLFASNAVACQMKEYNNSGLVVILHCQNSFQHNNYMAFSLLYVLRRENYQINVVCFPSFHNSCIPACKVWWKLQTREKKFSHKIITIEELYTFDIFQHRTNIKSRFEIKAAVEEKASSVHFHYMSTFHLAY